MGVLYKTRSFEMTTFSLESIPVYKYIQGDPNQNLSLSVCLTLSVSLPRPSFKALSRANNFNMRQFTCLYNQYAIEAC